MLIYGIKIWNFCCILNKQFGIHIFGPFNFLNPSCGPYQRKKAMVLVGKNCYWSSLFFWWDNWMWKVQLWQFRTFLLVLGIWNDEVGKNKIREIAILAFIEAHVRLMTSSFFDSDATISCNRLYAIHWYAVAFDENWHDFLRRGMIEKVIN